MDGEPDYGLPDEPPANTEANLRVPPHSIQAEACVLGAMIIESAAVMEAIAVCKAADFYRPAHQSIFQTITDLSLRGDPVDLISVREELAMRGQLESGGGIDYLVRLVEGVPSAANVTYYAGIVRRHARSRDLIVLGSELQADGFNMALDPAELIHHAQLRLHELSLACEDAKEDMPIRKALDAAISQAERVEKDSGILLSTGITELDEFLGGLLPGEVVTLGARTSSGKTSLAVNIVAHCAKLGHTAVIVSGEMPGAQIAKRFIQSQAQIWGGRFRTGTLSDSDWQCAQDAAEAMVPWRVHIVGKALTVPQISLRTRQLGAQWGSPVNLVVIDYLQIMRAHEGKTIREQVMAMSRDIKLMALELGTTVLLLSQFSRAMPDSKGIIHPPTISDLKESGTIEQDADIVLLLHAPEPQPEHMRLDKSREVWLRVGKGRDIGDTCWPDPDKPGSPGIRLRFHPGLTLFTDWMTPLQSLPRLQGPPRPPVYERTGRQNQPLMSFLASHWDKIAGE